MEQGRSHHHHSGQQHNGSTVVTAENRIHFYNSRIGIQDGGADGRNYNWNRSPDKQCDRDRKNQ